MIPSADAGPTANFEFLEPDRDVTAFLSPRVGRLFEHWRDLCNGRVLPARADIDPSAIRDLLPHLMLVDIVGPQLRARYRLVGTAVVDMAKLDFTGQYADEIDFKEVEEFDYAAAYRQVATGRRPGLGHSAVLIAGFPSRWIEFIICPLSEDGATVTQCVSLEDYEAIDLIERDAIPAAQRVTRD